MFELNNHSAYVNAVTFYAERHGEKRVKCFALNLTVNVHCSQLKEFDGKLVETLYREPGKGEQQRLDMEKLTERRLPRLKPLKWAEDFTGYTLVLVDGLGVTEEDPLELEVDLSSFEFEPKDGGSVEVTFSAKGRNDASFTADLVEQLQEEVRLHLIAPKADAQKASQQALNVDAPANDREKVIVAKVLLTENRKRNTFKPEVTFTDDRTVQLDEIAYRPEQEHVADLLRFKGFEPEFTPACVTDAWPKKAA